MIPWPFSTLSIHLHFMSRWATAVNFVIPTEALRKGPAVSLGPHANADKSDDANDDAAGSG